MSKVTADISVSLDGFAAGPNQSLEKPFGDGVEDESLHTWMFDEAEAKANAAEIAAITKATPARPPPIPPPTAYVMARNIFSPGRGEWTLDWKVCWGHTPPYHGPVF